MQTSKWLLYGCISSLIIGLALVSPLLFMHTVIDPFAENPPLYLNPQSYQSQIAINLTNIHLKLGNTSLPQNMTSLHYTPSPDIIMVTHPTLSCTINIAETKYLNNQQYIPDAEIDCFSIQILTDNGTVIEKLVAYIGTAYKRSFDYDSHPLNTDDLLGKTFGPFTMGGTFERVWSIGTTIPFNRAFCGCINQTTADIIKDSNNLTLILSRVGTIAVYGNTTSVTTSDAGAIETVTLTKQDNSFFYNQDGSSKPIPLTIEDIWL